MEKFEKANNFFDSFDKMVGYFEKAWGWLIFILSLPLTIASKAAEAVNTVAPTIPLPGIVEFLISLLTFAWWFGYLETKGLGKLRGGILRTVAWIAIQVYLFLACQVLGGSGAIVAIGFLCITMAVCAPSTWQKFRHGIDWGFNQGKNVAVLGGKAARMTGKVVTRINLRNPFAASLESALDDLHAACIKKGVPDDAKFLRLAHALGEELAEEHQDRRQQIEDQIEAYAADKGIHKLEIRPIAEAALLDLGEKA